MRVQAAGTGSRKAAGPPVRAGFGSPTSTTGACPRSIRKERAVRPPDRGLGRVDLSMACWSDIKTTDPGYLLYSPQQAYLDGYAYGLAMKVQLFQRRDYA